MIDFTLGYFAIGLLAGLLCAADVTIVLSMLEGQLDGEGAMLCFAFGFLFWPVTLPFLAWIVWKEHR